MSELLIRKNPLETILDLEEKSPVDLFYDNPSIEMFHRIPNHLRTSEMVTLLVSKGVGGIQWINKDLLTNEAWELAIENNGLNIKFMPSDLITHSLALNAVRYCIPFCFENTEYPIKFVPSELITKELVFESVKNSPCSLKDVPLEFMSKELVELVVSGNGKSLEFVPESMRSKDICKLALENDLYAFKWIPKDYMDNEMLLIIIEAPNSYNRNEIIKQDFFQEKINNDIFLLNAYSQRLSDDKKINKEKQQSMIENGKKLVAGKEREDFLRKFLELPNGIPDSNTFRRLFEKLDPEGLSKCLVNWLEVELPERCIIAVDGKTIKGSKSKAHKAYHVVSAFVADNHITLGEVTVDEKSNEITAVPELLDMLYLDNAIITADAMSCQKTIVEKIISENADYVIGLKNNQRSLYKFAEKCFENLHPDYPMIEFNERYHCFETTRKYYLSDEIENTPKCKMWCGLRRIGSVVSEYSVNGQIERETRYFITSLTDLREFANAVRKHWAVENNLHWSLDVVFREDASRAKKDNSPLNLNVLRKMAITLLTKAKTGRLGKRKMMFKAALNPDVLLSILLAYS